MHGGRHRSRTSDKEVDVRLLGLLEVGGHATQRDWQMGYSGPNMAMVHKDGRLISIDTKKQPHPAGSTEPKVYFGTGNCLIGDVDKPDCMVLSWLKDGGARQFMGYTITTWFGAQGWGTQGLFVDTAGLTTANEAFHFTNTGIVEKIRSYGIPDMMDFRFTELKSSGNFPVTPGMQRWAVNLAKSGKPAPEVQKALQERVGHLHDRDVVCFYGDPALDARIADGRWKMCPPPNISPRKFRDAIPRKRRAPACMRSSPKPQARCADLPKPVKRY